MDEATRAVMFSNATDEWSTPRDLLDLIRQEYPLQLDVCADASNAAAASRYFDKEIDGLAQDWAPWICWMNPPYGRAIGRWVKKAAEEAARGATVVCLLPSRTDTAWWHDYCQPVLDGKRVGEVVFLRGRLKFGGCPNPAPFPSVIVVFKPWGVL
jgi:site-specific DNA-methyltransferase (adenine-specific)